LYPPVASKLFRPLPGCVVDAEDDDDGITYAIWDDIGEAGNDQLAGVRNSAGASSVWESGESFGGGDDLEYRINGGGGVVPHNSRFDVGEVATRFTRPLYLHGASPIPA